MVSVWYNASMIRALVTFVILFTGAGLLLSQTALANDSIQYDITGIHGAALKNSLAALKAAEKQTSAHNSAASLQRLFNQGEAVIRKALQPYGYFSPTIHSSFKRKAKPVIFHYQVNPGSSTVITELNLQINGPGKNNVAFVRLQQNFPLQIGQTFTTKSYADAKHALFELASEQGYLRARLTQHRVNIDPHSGNAVVELRFNTGKQYFFGPVHFADSALSPSFLQRYVRFKPKDIYSTDEVLQLQQNLSNAGYFKQVMVQPRIAKAKQQHVPLFVSLTPAKKMRYSLSGGYGTDTGYRAGAGWQWRQINSQGHHLSMQVNASQIGNSVDTTYYIPGANPITEQYSLNSNIAYYTTNAGTSSIQSYGVMYNNTKLSWQSTAGVTYQYERYKLRDTDEQQAAHLLMPTVTWMYLFSDNPLAPERGLRFSLNLRGALKSVFSDSTFGQFRLRMRTLLPLNHNNRIFLQSDVGGTSTSDFNKLPLSLRFTAGGAQSVRGYGYQSLGPGKDLLTGTAEYQYRIHGNWFAGIFDDAGNAFNDFSKPAIKSAAGVSILWQSPIGTMALSVAKSNTDTHQPVAVQFSMGALL